MKDPIMPYKTIFVASVKRGAGRGKMIGVPTINLEIPEKINVPHGIYCGWLFLEKKYRAVIHYGPIPVFAIDTPSLEVHIIDDDITLNDTTISFQLHRRLRDIKMFNTPEEMVEEIKNDITLSKQYLK